MNNKLPSERLWTPHANMMMDMRKLATEVNEKYPNLSLAWIPPEFRGPGDDRPYAIVYVDSEGNITGIVMRMYELQFHASYIFNWLYDHDSTRTDVFGNMVKEIEKEKEQREKKYTEHVYELAEKIHAVQKSPLHTYRINGHKVGAENNVPTIGLFDADRENQ